MPQYVIEVPHSPRECLAAARQLMEHPRGRELIARTYWGCGTGVHTTWLVDEFTSDQEARSLVPPLLRDTARVVPVERLTWKSSGEGSASRGAAAGSSPG